MKVELLAPDAAPAPASPTAGAGIFAKTLDDVAATLDRATRAEDAFAGGGGSLQDAVYERARADVALSVATAAASRASQALTSILTMQI
ncbi:MAG: flagellar hook-basal body complex protein FliE [Candidatus Eremiobacteraeota bacterium]|nr:flagellar hook-basal body complex protein FliE [Candidatus Eremiobacteraeota bacterium]